ncbi:hypothetical protein [Hymenobacter wooponensis]|uniref:Uncharacterized protein n=1 Tax=Hymenobacter wooponensis TaxID=1525360 RepID=A0A4Z0MQ49_9BACT|nr:hypothetical protein [Hymenobacter wooponensis]TGD81540.1 hypothetical protein EU557_08285 [Hymenobacter wooponensis]
MEKLLQHLAEHGELLSQEGVQRRTLSSHDHWLSEEEADGASLSFGTLESLQEYRFYLQEEDRFVRLLASLFRTSEVFFVEPTSATILPLESWANFIAVSTSGLREQTPFLLYIKSLDAVLVSAYDLNVGVYFLDSQHLATVTELALGYGLHLL